MTWIPWNDILRTGHADIDAEHMELVRLVNELYDAVKQKRGESVYDIVLDDIIEHTISHFALEAKLMEKHQYPKTAQHIVEHARLIERAKQYRAKFKSGSPGSHIDLIHFPEDWLTLHIVTSDKELAEFLAKVDPARQHRGSNSGST